MKSILLQLALMLILVGCAGSQIAPLPQKTEEHTFQSEFNTTWQAMINVLNDRQLPIIVADKNRGIIVTDFVVAKMDRLSALFPPNSSDFTKQGRYKLNISVTSAGNQTRVSINARFERFSLTTAERLLGQNLPTWKPQESVGVLEPEIFKDIQAALSRGTEEKK